MSSEATNTAVPVAAEANTSAVDSAPAAFGASVLGDKPAASKPDVESQPAPAAEHTSEQDAAAVAAAAAADASSAAQTITELATAATNAASDAAATTSAQPTDSAVADAPVQSSDVATTAVDAASGDAASSEAQQDGQPEGSAAAAGEEQSTSGLPRTVESELRDIYSVSSSIANFCVAHVNQVNVPTPQKVRTVIQKALKLTSSLSMLLAQPEVALRQLDADEHGKRPAESKLDSARKRQRSSDWDGKIGGSPGMPMTPGAGLRVFPDGSLPTSLPSPGFDADQKGPQYKKRSRAPAPGSCQACGTSETPEWRRGPDGARTLCNACGLHYAKLVRKRMQQEGGVEESPSQQQASPQVSLVSLEELRASTKSAEAAAAAGSPSGSSVNGTPMKGDRGGASVWNTPSKPPRVPSGLSNSVVASSLEGDKNEPAQQPPTEGIVEPNPTPAEPVIAPELQSERVSAPAPAPAPAPAVATATVGDQRPMETDA